MFNYAIKELLKRNKLYLLNAMVIGLVTLMIVSLSCLGTAYKEASRLPFQDVQGNIIIQRNGNVPENMSGVLLSCSLAPILKATDLGTSISKNLTPRPPTSESQKIVMMTGSGIYY